MRQYTCRLIDELAPPEDHDELIGRGEAFIGRVVWRAETC